jgi:catechol 2,3-dioxygenase-like lactoylglutathione lyase family enzyme
MGAVANHVGQLTPDLERAKRFYIDLLGFTLDREIHVPDAGTAPLLGLDAPLGTTASYLRLGEFTLELLHFADAESRPQPRTFLDRGLTHLSLSVDDLESVVSRVGDYGGSVHTVALMPHAAMVRDPDGQLLELLPMSYRDSLSP